MDIERDVIFLAKADRTDGLRVPRVARSPKVATFVPTTTTDRQPHCTTLDCACAREVLTDYYHDQFKNLELVGSSTCAYYESTTTLAI